MGGHSHHRTGAVAQEDIVGDPDGHFLTVEPVDAISPEKDAVLLLFRGKPLDLTLAARLQDVRLDLGLLFRRGQPGDQRVLRRQHHEGYTEDGIGAGGKYPDLFLGHAGVVKAKRYLRAEALADPVALHALDALGPVDTLELQQLVGVLRDPEEPLLEVAADDRGLAALADALPHHLLIGQDGLAIGAPVNRGAGAVSQPGLVELQEEPLGPFVVLRQAGNDLPGPIVDSADALDLAAHVIDVLHRPLEGVDAALDGGVLRGEAEGVKAIGMQDVIAPHAHIAGMDIGGNIVIPVADMEVAGGIGEHGKGVPLGAGVVVPDLVKLIVGPLLLPLLFYFLRVILLYHACSSLENQSWMKTPVPLSSELERGG